MNQPKVVSINNQYFDCTSGEQSDTTRKTPGEPMRPLQIGAKTSPSQLELVWTSSNWLEPNGSGFIQCQAVKASWNQLGSFRNKANNILQWITEARSSSGAVIQLLLWPQTWSLFWLVHRPPAAVLIREALLVAPVFSSCRCFCWLKENQWDPAGTGRSLLGPVETRTRGKPVWSTLNQLESGSKCCNQNELRRGQ